jgi:lipopolysaccharide export system permease protein
MLPFTIPATLLLTVTVVYGRMAGDQEITAAKAAGISALSLLWPSFLMSGALCICALVLEDQAIPWAMKNIERAVALATEDIFLDILRSQHQFVKNDKGIVIAVEDVVGKKLIRPTIQHSPKGQDAVTIQAAEGSVTFDLENQEVNLHLRDIYIDSNSRYTVHAPREQTITFPIDNQNKRVNPRYKSIHENRNALGGLVQGLETRRRERDIETALALAVGDFDHLAHPDLHQYDVDAENNRVDIARYRTAIHSRFALSTSCVFFALLGGPFAILQARRQFLTSFFMCFVPILVLYYPIALLMMSLSKSSTVNPAWAMWTGNLVLLGVALFVLRKVLKH